MKAYIHEDHPQFPWDIERESVWKNLSASYIQHYLSNLQSNVMSLENDPSGPYTFLSKELVNEIKSLPDYPKIEKDMKMVYGSGWELVSYEEAEEKLNHLTLISEPPKEK